MWSFTVVCLGVWEFTDEVLDFLMEGVVLFHAAGSPKWPWVELVNQWVPSCQVYPFAAFLCVQCLGQHLYPWNSYHPLLWVDPDNWAPQRDMVLRCDVCWVVDTEVIHMPLTDSATSQLHVVWHWSNLFLDSYCQPKLWTLEVSHMHSLPYLKTPCVRVLIMTPL